MGKSKSISLRLSYLQLLRLNLGGGSSKEGKIEIKIINQDVEPLRFLHFSTRKKNMNSVWSRRPTGSRG